VPNREQEFGNATAEVAAAIPKRIARDMFRVVPGDGVRVAGVGGARPTILGFVR
jgi:hypothetical protein